jgi:rhodanese-related sulfurtransferase
MNALSQIPEITPIDLEQRIEAGNTPLLVDVREPFEAKIADLPEVGQLRIPTGELVERLHEVDRDRDVVVYCRSGSRSARAVKLMLRRGYERVWNLEGGVLKWRTDVDPSLRAY